MLRSLVLLAFVFFSSLSFANNYVDNPNFDLGKKGWLTLADNFCLDWGHYEEQSEGHTILDRCLATQYWTEMEFYYIMGNVPQNIPLYFYAELGFEGTSAFEVTISLYETISKASNIENEHPFEKGSGESLLVTKTIRMTNNDQWNVVSSDFPVYKKAVGTLLQLMIVFKPINNAGIFQINYAQVGTDPKSLGGRLLRPKQPCTYKPVGCASCCRR